MRAAHFLNKFLGIKFEKIAQVFTKSVAVFVLFMMILGFQGQIFAADTSSPHVLNDVNDSYFGAPAADSGNFSATSITDLLVNTALMLAGVNIPGSLFGTNPELDAKVPEAFQKGGLAYVSTNAAYTTFEYLPAIDIPNHFAEQFLPEQMRDTSVKAQDSSTYDYLQKQGLGKVWTAFFNIAMIGFVIVIIAAGFMVMFKTKLGQANVTVANAILRIVIGVALALGSFAIGALIIDFSKWLTVLIQVSMVKGAFGVEPISAINPLSLATSIFWDTSVATWAITDTFTGLLGWGFFNLGGFGALLSLPITLLLIIIIALIIIVASFRIFIRLITIYLRLIFDILLAPIIILVGSIPGQEKTITEWFKRMFANALAIPFIYLFIHLAVFIAQSDINVLFFVGTEEAVQQSDFLSVFPLSVIMGIVVYMIAANGDAVIKELLGVRDMQSVTEAVTKGKSPITKIPVVGGLFG